MIPVCPGVAVRAVTAAWLAVAAALPAQANLLCWPPTTTRYVTERWDSRHRLPQNTVPAIAQGPDGSLWIGTYGGLCHFDGETTKVYDSVGTPALRSNRITALLVSQDGTLWVGTDQNGLAAARDGVFRHVEELGELQVRALGVCATVSEPRAPAELE